MINNELKKVQLLSYSSETDEYGQLRQSTPTSIYIDMVIKHFNKTNLEDMRYVDVDVLGLTKYDSITDKNEIKDGNDIYQVLYVLNTSRYNQIFMRKKHE